MNLMLALLDRMLSALLRIRFAPSSDHRGAYTAQMRLQPIPIRSRRR